MPSSSPARTCTDIWVRLILRVLCLCFFSDFAEARGNCGTRECKETTLQLAFLVWILGVPALGAVIGWDEARSKYQKNWLLPVLGGALGGFVGWCLLAGAVAYFFGNTYWLLSLIAPLVSTPLIWFITVWLTRKVA